jgi:DNA modification methylase
MSAQLNQIISGDCLDALGQFGRGVFDMAYLDPPFNTGNVQCTPTNSYRDSWPDMDSYLTYMRLRLERVLVSLTADGVILLHCDWRTCHHFRLMLDDLLGSERFVNHLVWSYGLGGSSPRRFARKHDDILFYAKSDEYYFDPPQVPATSRRMQGQMKKATDVLVIPSLNNMADERVGYPTQKPLELLELLVRACCPPRGAVLDPFCGSGTTSVAAARLERRYVGIDSNPHAVKIARERCAIGTPVNL